MSKKGLLRAIADKRVIAIPTKTVKRNKGGRDADVQLYRIVPQK